MRLQSDVPDNTGDRKNPQPRARLKAPVGAGFFPARRANALIGRARRVGSAWAVLALSLALLLGASALSARRAVAPRVHAPIHGDDIAGVVQKDGALLIDINRADEALLLELPGIGQRRAQAIVRYREAHGAFASVDALKDVPGIPKAVFEAIRARLSAG
jgi:competence protein ComEA